MSPLSLQRLEVTLDGTPVVRGLSFSVEVGAWVGLIGPNGAGKTTVLRAMAGLVPYAGSIRVLGAEVASLSRRDVARRIALVPQSPVTPPEMTVLEYVVLGRTPYLGYSAAPRAEDVTAARSALGRLDAAHLDNRRLGTLSGGERQRAVLARAIAQDASLVLLDEPTTALDVGGQQQVLELVAGLRASGGLTVVSAMHDLTAAGQYADWLLLLDDGLEVASGRPREVLCEDVIARHYKADVRVFEDGRGGIAVVPVRATHANGDSAAS